MDPHEQSIDTPTGEETAGPLPRMVYRTYCHRPAQPADLVAWKRRFQSRLASRASGNVESPLAAGTGG